MKKRAFAGPVTPAQLHALGEHTPANDLQRGETLFNIAKGVAHGLPELAHGASRAANAVLAPAAAVGPGLLKAFGHAQDFVAKTPGLGKLLIGGAVLAPILSQAANASKSHEEQSLLRSSLQPERTVLASLKRHHLKTAGFSDSARRGMGASLGGGALEAAAKGFGGGMGEMLFSGASMLGKSVLESQVTAPKREKVFYEAIKSDQILRDALKNNPSVLAQLKEAFSTMVRFAPSLAMDISAVRSYLREAVLSGGGINYATVKQLAETEKIIQERNRGGHR